MLKSQVYTFTNGDSVHMGFVMIPPDENGMFVALIYSEVTTTGGRQVKGDNGNGELQEAAFRVWNTRNVTVQEYPRPKG